MTKIATGIPLPPSEIQTDAEAHGANAPASTHTPAAPTYDQYFAAEPQSGPRPTLFEALGVRPPQQTPAPAEVSPVPSNAITMTERQAAGADPVFNQAASAQIHTGYIFGSTAQSETLVPVPPREAPPFVDTASEDYLNSPISPPAPGPAEPSRAAQEQAAHGSNLPEALGNNAAIPQPTLNRAEGDDIDQLLASVDLSDDEMDITGEMDITEEMHEALPQGLGEECLTELPTAPSASAPDERTVRVRAGNAVTKPFPMD